MFKPVRLCVLALIALVGVGCAVLAPKPTPTPIPPPPPPTPTAAPTNTPLPTATPIPPTVAPTATAIPTALPTATRLPTAVPILNRRSWTGSYLFYPVPPATNGCGMLAIQNNLDLDIVAIMAVYTPRLQRALAMAGVYINAHDYYAFLNLGSDNFLAEVYVAAGEDWDNEVSKFTRKNLYFHTPDRWMIPASPSCANWVFKVVPQGSPDLPRVPENQFIALQ